MKKKLQEAQLIKLYNIFDTKNYLQNYPDVAKSGIEPIVHYVLYGADEGRMPTTWFDTKLYLENNKEVASTGINPFLHYMLYGAKDNKLLYKIDPELGIKQARQTMQDKNYLAAMQLWTFVFLQHPHLRCNHEDEMEFCLVQGLLNNNNTLKTKLGQGLGESKFNKLLTLLQSCTDNNLHEQRRGALEAIVNSFPQASTQVANKKLLAFFSRYPANLKFFSEIIKCIPPHQIDIIFEHPLDEPKQQEQLLQECKLSGYSVLIGVDKITNYQAVLMDILSITRAPGMSYFLNKNPDIKTICMLHSIDDDSVIYNFQHCAIVSCKKHTKTIKNIPNNTLFTKEHIENNEDFLSKIHHCAKVEYGYAGPSHIGSYLHRRHQPKAIFKKEMEDVLQKQFDPAKKVVAVFENGAVLDVDLFPKGLNELAKHVHVILKAYTHAQPYLKELSPNITLWPVDLDAPNALRFGVDCVLAGNRTGTFFSSCMLGIPVIPFYTRYVHAGYGHANTARFGIKAQPHHSEWWLHLLDFENCKQPQYELSRIFLKNKKVFDFSQTQKLVEAIYKDEYWNWYNANLKIIQNEVYEDYLLEGSAEKTAQMVLDFAQNGTLGKNCESLYLRPEFYPQ